MADADWVNYKQIRGKALPPETTLLGTRYRLAAHLKRDFYAATGLYERIAPEDFATPAKVLLKIYHTEPFLGLPLGWLGRFLCRRETGFLRQLEGVAGVPQLRELYGESGFVRDFVPGCNLREYTRTAQVDAEFFPKFAAILDAVHARGVAHNDLSKPENVLVTTDGEPVLIDFQIASRILPNPGLLTRLWNPRLIAYMQGVDRYHLTKQNVYRRPDDFSTEARVALRRKGWIITVHGWLRRPYRALRHRILKPWLTPETSKTSSVPAPHVVTRPSSDDAAGTERVGLAEDRSTR